MPLTPTFQSAFQSAYRSGFTHNAGVFNSKRLDLSTNHDSSDTTISDRSPYGNDATLKSGVYFSTNGLTDKGINADCSAAGSGTYKLTGKVRSSSTGTKYVTMDGATADTLTINTADVWEDFESSTFTGTPSNVVMGWDGGSNFSACDWSDIRLIDTLDGSTVSHFQGNESGAGDLDGKLVVDSSGNGYHGAHIGCAGGSAEGMDPVLAGLPGELLWYDGVNDYVTAPTRPNYASSVLSFSFLYGSTTDDNILDIAEGTNYSFDATMNSLNLATNDLVIQSDNSGNSANGAIWRYNGLTEGVVYTVLATVDSSYQITAATINGVPMTTSGSGIARRLIDATGFSLGSRSDGLNQYKGVIHSFSVSTDSSFDWDGTLNNLPSGWTVNGSPITLATKRQTILQTAGQNGNPWMGFTGWENGEVLFFTLTDIYVQKRGGATVGVNYDAVADADSIGGANSGNYCLKLTTNAASLGLQLTTPEDDTTRQFELYYYVPSGQPDLELRNSNTMALYPTLLSGNLTTKDAWTKITFKWRVGVGNLGLNPWIGPAGAAGTVYFDDMTITNPSIYVPQLDTDSTIDALGFPIANPRPNNKVINLLADDAKATIAADASMDVTKTIEGWVYYDGTDQTFLDIGTPIINSSSDVLGSTLAGSLTYYVNGVATTALGSAGWKYIVIASDTAQATDAIDILATSAAWKFIDRTLTATEVLSRFNTSKFEYGFYYLRPDGSAILRPDGSQYIRPL